MEETQKAHRFPTTMHSKRFLFLVSYIPILSFDDYLRFLPDNLNHFPLATAGIKSTSTIPKLPEFSFLCFLINLTTDEAACYGTSGPYERRNRELHGRISQATTESRLL